MSLDKVSPSPVRDDPDIRDSRFAGREDEARETYRMYNSATRSARGFMPLWGYKHATPLQRKHETVLVDPAWYEGLRRLAATCERVRLPLMIRLTPIPAEGSQILNFEQVAQWLKDVRSACPNAIIGADPEIVRYPRELMWDGTHINTDGAAKFTAKLADDVRAAIGPEGHANEKK